MPRYDYWANAANGNQLIQLQRNEFFTKCLLPDIRSGLVFPAFRKTDIDFYYLGRKVCSWGTGTFKTNIAYLAAFQNRPEGEVTEAEFSQLVVCRSFRDAYSQIKSHISLYEQPESGEVARLLKDHSCFKTSNSGPIVVLDIELSLKALDEGRKQDRIDLVLFHLKEKRIRFVEVKMFENKEIWPTPEGKVAITGQIARYKRQRDQNCNELTQSYCQYVCLLRDLFGTKLPEPEAIDENVDLLITGFDTPQLQILQKKLLPAFGKTFRTSLRGSLSGASQGTLAKWWKKRLPPQSEDESLQDV